MSSYLTSLSFSIISLSSFESETDEIGKEIQKIVDCVNGELPSDRRIFDFRIRKTPFPRTSTGKIKRTEFRY